MKVTCVYKSQITVCDVCGITENFCFNNNIKFHYTKKDPWDYSHDRIFFTPPLKFSDSHDLCDMCYKKAINSENKNNGIFEYNDIIKK